MLLSLVVATEKPAYVPQEPIAVRVSGLAPGETVEMQVLHTDATPNAGAGHEPWQITDGGQDDRDGIVNGQVLTVCSLAADDSANSAFQVTARELTSGEVASAAFQGIQDQPPTRPSTTVTTDKPDYSPGETATITASGFTPGETVKFLALHIDDTPNTGVGHQPWEVTDGGVDDLDGAADGSVLTTWHLAEDDSLHSVFQVTATGLTSGLAATAEFSDAQTLVFSDDFPHNAWDHTKWSTDTIWIFRDNGDSGPINPPSYPYAAGFSGDNRDRLQSVGIDLSNALDAKLYYSLQCSGHMDWPAGGNFSIEYRNGSGSWNSLWMWSAGMFQSNSQWTTQSISFGPSFVSSNFQIRFCLYDESAFDWWFLDNVQLYATMNSSPTLNVSGTFGTQSDKVLAPPGPSFNWTASDVDGNLSTVSAVVKYNGSVIASPSWQVSGSSASGSVSPVFKGLGTYSITVTATDAKGAQTTSSEYSYTLKDDDTTPPIITFGGSQGTESHKAKQEFTWDVVDPPDPTYPYVSSGVGTVNVVVMQDGNPTPIYNNPAAPAKGSFNFDSYGLGTYTITVTATDADKDWVTATDSDAAKAGPVSRTVKVTNDPPVAEAGPGQRVDEGTLVRFDGGNSYDPEGDPLTYLWDFGDGNTGTGVQPSHTYQDAGAYPVTLTVSDCWGATATDSLVVTVRNMPPLITSVSNSGPVDPGVEARVFVTATDVPGDQSHLVYDFDLNNDGTFEQTSPFGSATAIFPAPGIYPVNIRVSDGDGGEAFGSTSVQVGPASGVTPAVTFLTAGQTVSEDAGDIVVPAHLAQALPVAAFVPLTLSGTASEPLDYTLQQKYLFFPAGATDASVRISVVDDKTYEPSEALTLTMGTPVNATVGGIASYTITIDDNDPPPQVRFTTTSQSVGKDGNAVLITAALSDPSEFETIVPLAFSGTATAPGDYNLPTGSRIVVAAGAQTGSATIPIINNTVPQRTKTVNFRIGKPANADLGSAAGQSVEIWDDDPLVSLKWDMARPDMLEQDAVLSVVARLSTPTNKAVTVPLKFFGSAIRNSLNVEWPDYDLLNSTITIPAGFISASIPAVRTYADNRYAPDRTLTVTIGPLSLLTNALPALDSSQCLVIREKDAPPQASFVIPNSNTANLPNGWQDYIPGFVNGLTPDPASLYESDQEYSIKVRLSRLSEVTTDVPISGWLDRLVCEWQGELVDRGDSRALPTQVLSFPPGVTEMTYTYSWIDEGRFESDENVAFWIGDLTNATKGNPWQCSITFKEANWMPNWSQMDGAATREWRNVVDQGVRDPLNAAYPGLGDKTVAAGTAVGTFIVAADDFFQSIKGYISGGTGFLDANKNGIRDFLDLDGDGIQGPGDPTEPAAVTRADGVFVLPMPPMFDRNGNGTIDPEEGQIVVTGGVDGSTGLPLTSPLIAPAGCFAVSPLTTLMASLVNSRGFSVEQAQQRVCEALGLPEVNLGLFDPIAQTLLGEADAPAVFAAGAKVYDTITEMAALVGNLPNAPPVATVSDLVVADMADKIVDSGSALDLGNPLVVETVIDGALARTGLIADAGVVSGAAAVIADANRHIDGIPVSGDLNFLTQVVQTETVSRGAVADQLANVAEGHTQIAGVVSTYTGYSLENQISTAAVGNIVTPVVSISDASVVKPDQGSTFLEFTVSLDRPPAAPVSVAFTTTGGYATPGVDYQPASGTLTWAPGDNSSKTVRVPVLAGTQSRTDESVLVELGNPSGAVISKYRGEGAIVNSGPVYYTAPADGQPNRLVLVLDGATFSIYRNDNLELSGKSAQPAPIEIAGADGMENALTVKFGSPGNASAGGVSYQGGSSADTLTIDDTAALAVLYTVTGPDSGSFNVDGTQISYTGVESVADQFAPAVTGFPATSAEGTEIFLHASPLDPAPAYNYD